MKRPISTKLHGILDLATVGLMLAMPRMLNSSEQFTRTMTALALGKLSYALLTRHELGMVPLIPMKTHLALDIVAGGGLCALPFVLKEDGPITHIACMAQGLFDIAAAPMTETVAPFDRANAAAPEHSVWSGQQGAYASLSR